MLLNITTYEQYMGLIADASPGRLYKDSRLIIERFRQPQNIFFNFSPTTFFVDYTTRKYIYIDKTCIDVVGYPDIYYYETGHEGFLRQTHSLDYAMVNRKVFPINLKYLNSIITEKYADIVFSHNFRLKDQQGKYRVILQRYSYVPGENTGQPVGVIGVAFDITHFKNDLTIVHTIEETLPSNNEMISNLIYKETYPVYETEAVELISRMELEVLKYMADGLSSKQIATRLKLSVNTISNHRKKMLSKTHCKTSAELLSYVVKHGLL